MHRGWLCIAQGVVILQKSNPDQFHDHLTVIKTFYFITLSQEQLKVQYIFEERHRSMKGKCLWGKCKKKVKKPNNSAFSATHTYIKLTLVSFFYFFYAPSPKPQRIWAYEKNACPPGLQIFARVIIYIHVI